MAGTEDWADITPEKVLYNSFFVNFTFKIHEMFGLYVILSLTSRALR